MYLDTVNDIGGWMDTLDGIGGWDVVKLGRQVGSQMEDQPGVNLRRR